MAVFGAENCHYYRSRVGACRAEATARRQSPQRIYVLQLLIRKGRVRMHSLDRHQEDGGIS